MASYTSPVFTRKFTIAPPPPPTATAAANSSGQQPNIEPPNVEKLAQLAQIGVSEQEAADWAPKIAGIVEWFGQLQQADLEGIPPALRADVDDTTSLRPDIPTPFKNREDMLKQVPLMDGAFVRVPKMSSGTGATD